MIELIHGDCIEEMAKQLNRNFIGIEKVEDCYNIAAERIKP